MCEPVRIAPEFCPRLCNRQRTRCAAGRGPAQVSARKTYPGIRPYRQGLQTPRYAAYRPLHCVKLGACPAFDPSHPIREHSRQRAEAGVMEESSRRN